MADITIPDESEKAAASAYTAVIYNGNGTTREFHAAINAAILAAIKAWPGANTENREVLNFGNNIDGPIVSTRRLPFLVIPLPQKPEGRIDQEGDA